MERMKTTWTSTTRSVWNTTSTTGSRTPRCLPPRGSAPHATSPSPSRHGPACRNNLARLPQPRPALRQRPPFHP
eukprot:2338098-Rhodomonas_salina.1